MSAHSVASAHSVSVHWAATSDSVVWRDINEKSGTRLAAVGESVLPGGFRTTALTHPVGVIDIAVLVVARVRATGTLVVRRERIERSIVDYVLNGSHVLAESVAVDVMRARAGHQFLGHVVDGNGVLVVFGVLVALVGDSEESGGIDVEGELFGLCAVLCCLVSFKLRRQVRTHRLHGIQKTGAGCCNTRRVSTHARGHRSSYAKLCIIPILRVP